MADILGDEIEVHVLYSGSINERKLRRHGITSHQYGRGVIGLSPLRQLSLIYNIYRLARDQGVSIFMNVWAHYMLFPIIIGAKLGRSKVIARIAGIPIRGDDPKLSHWRRIKRRLGLALESLSLRYADHVHVVAESLKSVILQRGIDPSKITVISQGVDIDKFTPFKGIEDCSKRKVLFVGRLVVNKGVRHVIQAFSEVASHAVDTELIIVGEGPDKDMLKQLCCELDLTDRVRFLGYVPHDDLPSVYHSSALLVLPSHSEGLSNVVMEAQACGLPIIGTDVGDLSLQLADGRGIILSSLTPNTLAKEITQLLADGQLRCEMGKRGRAYVEREHSFARVREGYLKMFHTVLSSSFPIKGEEDL